MAQKPKSVLQLRILEKIKQVLSTLFSESEMSFGNKKFFISINNIDISPNLRNLKIYVDILNLDLKIKNEVVKNLNKDNIKLIKQIIADKVNLRYVPEPLFLLDDSNEKIYKINKIIEKASKDLEATNLNNDSSN